MEEKKIVNTNESKKVKLNIGNMEEGKKKLTYEQLNDTCNQLWLQNRQLAVKNRELEQFVMNKRLDYLFKVVEYSSSFSSDFVVSCSNEIEEALTIPQNDKEDKENQ